MKTIKFLFVICLLACFSLSNVYAQPEDPKKVTIIDQMYIPVDYFFTPCTGPGYGELWLTATVWDESKIQVKVKGYFECYPLEYLSVTLDASLVANGMLQENGVTLVATGSLEWYDPDWLILRDVISLHLTLHVTVPQDGAEPTAEVLNIKMNCFE